MNKEQLSPEYIEQMEAERDAYQAALERQAKFYNEEFLPGVPPEWQRSKSIGRHKDAEHLMLLEAHKDNEDFDRGIRIGRRAA